MGFRDPIVAGQQLIIPGIQSEDYDPGLAGWRVGKDGSAEFRDVVVSGADISSQNYQPGVAGWRIANDGSAEFRNVLISGADISSQNYVEAETGWKVEQSGAAEFQDLSITSSIGAAEVNATKLYVAGRNVQTELDLLQLLRNRPYVGEQLRGGYFYGSNLTSSAQTNGEMGLVELDTGFLRKAGWYRVGITQFLVGVTGGAPSATTEVYSYCRMLGTQDGVTVPGTPQVTSAITRRGVRLPMPTSGLRSLSMDDIHYFNAGDRYRFLFTYGITGQPAGVNAYLFGDQYFGVYCIFHDEPQRSWGSNVGVQASTGGGTLPAPSQPASERTKDFAATWSRSFNGSGGIRFDDSPYCYHGYWGSNNGDQRSLIGFDYAAIQAELSGASVVNAYLTIRLAHRGGGGGLDARIGTHNYTSNPGSWSAANVNHGRILSNDWGEGITRAVPLGWTIANDFKTGIARGISLGPANTTSDNGYGYFYGATHTVQGAPYLTIVYNK